MDDLNVNRHNQKHNRIDASVNNVPTSYSTATGSLLLTGIALARGLAIINTSSTALAVNYKTESSTSAPSVTLAECPAAPSGSYSAMVMDNVEVGPCIYIKSLGSAITSGTVSVFIW